jgi:hypothetical protein
MPDILLATPGFIFGLLALVAGCSESHRVEFVDVTNIVRSSGSYRAGDVYRIRTDAVIVRQRPASDGEEPRQSLRSSASWSEHPDAQHSLVAPVPAGATLRVDRLIYVADVYPGEGLSAQPLYHRPQIVDAICTIRSSQGEWQNVIAPTDPQFGADRQDGMIIISPDINLVEKVQHN